MAVKKKKKVVAVSGGFDPIHVGHIRMFGEAKKLGDVLVVILNNDNWLRKKKGAVFMAEGERKEVIEAIGCVDRVVLTRHPRNPADMTVSRDLARVKPHIFANGGDRTAPDRREAAACARIKCAMVHNVGRGGKVQSSSWLLTNYLRRNGKIKQV
ncbi:MAG: hypothetical protein A3A43_02595 [Candidatus Liptonbacteria bacterium RIFCSPLOWO2_01_FULL_56_20]|uniref:Cytidyltransferase-like domain-containing protein n=1 Tax=Candidatus Liptonbacteria bacterium RIFCSPLOWO2_01_FULL_56_20 TaxID=1798652 RepID=A0A1G2CJF0_9BACT|nr:MAG: Glycerol-3-phosphate cytidylyltransferase [Parcubacteria group bacterium GW2011_GWB1_56_8]OGY98243.1 MAG: hypothetical protein A2681_00240 [Candidatus Liptonbacteria bacterium RIFCSPHIGHO2_01_FULL_56_18b]OGZ00860.1 MAG: hypothetical protein A3A43_02595 [Candidatus Liptonbacteria bacterium RIFCSPLOWO2_01_FULL_56_20]